VACARRAGGFGIGFIAAPGPRACCWCWGGGVLAQAAKAAQQIPDAKTFAKLSTRMRTLLDCSGQG
jgi:hypothetical protein